MFMFVHFVALFKFTSFFCSCFLTVRKKGPWEIVATQPEPTSPSSPPEQETHEVRFHNSLSIVEKRTSTPRCCCCCNSFGQFAYCVPIWKFPKWKYIYWRFFEQRTSGFLRLVVCSSGRPVLSNVGKWVKRAK